MLSTFSTSKKEPVHRWFSYYAGFSAQWVREVLMDRMTDKPLQILDPFAGIGTTLIEARKLGLFSRGTEVNHFIHRLAFTKLNFDFSPSQLKKRANLILEHAQKINNASELIKYEDFVHRCYSNDSLIKLDALLAACRNLGNPRHLSCADPVLDDEGELCRLAIVSILRETSTAKSSGQYILPNKTKAKPPIDPFVAFNRKIEIIIEDLKNTTATTDDCEIICCGAGFYDGDGHQFNLIITSPPYANNFDYLEAMRLELLFLNTSRLERDEIKQEYRMASINSSTQNLRPDYLHQVPKIFPLSEMKSTFKTLESEKDLHGGKKNYHLMILNYFSDMWQVFKNLRKITTPDAELLFVVGDSAPYGIHVPTERWLGELAIASGFSEWNFQKIRERNTKWESCRKHKTPLHEGVLTIC